MTNPTAEMTPQERHREKMRARMRIHRGDIRDIGVGHPKCVDPERRESCQLDLHKFLTTYFPEAFAIEFGSDHLEFISAVQKTILTGGQYLILMPRGSGKTTILVRSVMWAALFGHRRFIMLIAAEQTAANRILSSIQTILESNELLYEDFPEVIHPIRKLERITIRTRGQLCDGEPTLIGWGQEIQFPQTKYTALADNAGVGIKTAGIESAGIRGSQMTLKDGSVIRPDCVLIDDPSTRLTASSPVRNGMRESLINSDILMMAGPTEKIACLISATCICPGDLTEMLMDRERNPHWTTRKVAMVQSWPDQIGLWEQWSNIRRQEMFEEVPQGSANEFYASRRSEMDAGFRVYWEGRVEPGFLSAKDSAMSHYFDSPGSFASEYQNDPQADADPAFVPLQTMEVAKRGTSTKRGIVPPGYEKLVAHIDVQKRMLFWAVCAVNNNFGMHVVDYGQLPKQSTRNFYYPKAKRTLQHEMPGESDETVIRIAIAQLIEHLNSKTWVRDGDNAEMVLDRGLVDAQFMPVEVEAAIRTVKARNWMPSRGIGVGAKDTPLGDRKFTKGMKGDHYVIQKPNNRTMIGIFADVNYWKSHVHSALQLHPGHPEAITFYQASPSHHQMLADHCCAEKGTFVAAKGRRIMEWTLLGGKDNHHFDNLVGCCVAACLAGLKKKGVSIVDGSRKRPSRRIKLKI